MSGHSGRTVLVDGVELGQGSRVRLRPGRSADVLDIALSGRTAEVDAVEEDLEGGIHVVVTLDGDDGADFRTGLGHRFFFTPEEVEPVTGLSATPRLLIAGVGNIFLADDAFGPEVITAMRELPLRDGVHIADFGIRGMDLAYRLQDGYDVAVLVDAAPRGAAPGTLHLIEPEQADRDDSRRTLPEAHGMDPVNVLALARHLGGEKLPRVLVLGCEPSVQMRGDEPDVVVGLSMPVRAAVDRAVEMLESLIGELLRDPLCDLSGGTRSNSSPTVRS